MRIEPTVARLMAIAYAKGYDLLHLQTPEQVRKRLFKTFFKSPKPPTTAEYYLDLQETVNHLRLRFYKPPASGAPFLIPPILFWRGSAYIGGHMDDTNERCLAIATSLNTTVVSLDYPHLPEAAFPAAFERSLSTVVWLLQEKKVAGVSFEQCCFWGESCGGTIALSVAQRLEPSFKQSLQYLILFYPDLDNSRHYASHQAYGQGYLFDQAFRDWMYHHYLQDQSLRSDPRISPLLGSMTGLAPSLLMIGECDPARDEVYALHDALNTHQIPVQTITYLGLTHGFLLYEHLVPRARNAFKDALALIHAHFAFTIIRQERITGIKYN